MSPAHFVDVRKTFGGPSPSETTRAIAQSRKALQDDRDAWKSRRDRLQSAENDLAARAKAL
jgi:hypothetical protein